jgi:hypothetical protein
MKTNKETIARTIVSIIVGVLTLLKMFGVDIPYSEESLYTVALACVMVCTWAYGFWKNEDFTSEALEATGLMRERKKQKEDGDKYIGEVM